MSSISVVTRTRTETTTMMMKQWLLKQNLI